MLETDKTVENKIKNIANKRNGYFFAQEAAAKGVSHWSLAEWHEKYGSLFTDEAIDKIFERDRTIEPDLRHPEDFDLAGEKI